MYYDSPEWMSSFNLLRCLYMNHPVKIDIAGTKETIAEIDDKMLYQCYDIFYNLLNMVLVVVGNVDVDNVVSICDENLKEAPEFTAVRIFENEPDEIIKSYEECHIDVGVPVFSFGYKEKCEEPEQSLKKICEIDILLEILIGKASHLYSSLIDKGLINENFSKEYFIGNGYECIMFEGESNSPEEVVCEIKNEIKRLQQDGIDDEIFESVYRDQYGREIMGYNDIEELANMYISGYFSGYNPLDVFDILKDLKKEDIEKHLTTMFRDDKSALSVVKAK